MRPKTDKTFLHVQAEMVESFAEYFARINVYGEQLRQMGGCVDTCASVKSASLVAFNAIRDMMVTVTAVNEQINKFNADGTLDARINLIEELTRNADGSPITMNQVDAGWDTEDTIRDAN